MKQRGFLGRKSTCRDRGVREHVLLGSHTYTEIICVVGTERVRGGAVEIGELD